jgi:dTDP-4-dehydrorhamnose reductase
VPKNEVVSPTYLPDLVHGLLDLLIDGEAGIWHLTNRGEVPFDTFIREIACQAGLDLPWSRPLPPSKGTPLVSARGWILPTWQEAAARYAQEIEPRVRAFGQFQWL